MKKTITSPFPDIVEFTFGDEVYHKTKPDEMGVVTGIFFKPGCHMFQVQWSKSSNDCHYAFELSKEKNYTTD